MRTQRRLAKFVFPNILLVGKIMTRDRNVMSRVGRVECFYTKLYKASNTNLDFDAWEDVAVSGITRTTVQTNNKNTSVQSMAWMETDYSELTHFRWKIKWRLEHLGVL